MLGVFLGGDREACDAVVGRGVGTPLSPLPHETKCGVFAYDTSCVSDK